MLFDLDGTLFDHPAAFGRGILAHLQRLGGPYRGADPDTVVAAWRAAEDRHYARYLAGELDYLGQRRERVRDFTAGFGVTGLDDEGLDRWFGGYHTAYRDSWAAYPDVDAALRALSGIDLGIITNGELDLQRLKVEHIGLTSRMRHLVASGDFGQPKPSPAIFRHTTALFGARPDQAVYVGDRLRVDAFGAAGAGLTGVWLDRDGRGWGDAAAEARERGIRRIVSLTELPDLLTRL